MIPKPPLLLFFSLDHGLILIHPLVGPLGYIKYGCILANNIFGNACGN